MFSKEQAAAFLGISIEDCDDLEKVKEAYHKMRRRYPEQSFPDKYRNIKQAYELLSIPKKIWEDLISSKNINLSWAESYLLENSKEATKPEPLDTRAFRLSLVRHAYLPVLGCEVKFDGDNFLEQDEFDESDLDFLCRKFKEMAKSIGLDEDFDDVF